MIPSTLSVQLSWLENIRYSYNTTGLSSALFAVFCFSGKSRTISVFAAQNYIKTFPDSGLTPALTRKIDSRMVTHSPTGNLQVQTTTPRAAPESTQTLPIPQVTAQSSSCKPAAPAPKKVRFLTQTETIVPVKSQSEPLVTNTHNPGRERQVASTSDQTNASSLTSGQADTKPIGSDQYLHDLCVKAGLPMRACPEVNFALKSIDERGEFPPLSEAETLLNLPCMKKGWQGNDQAVENNSIDLPKLMRFAIKFKNKGIVRATNEAKTHFLELIHTEHAKFGTPTDLKRQD